MNIKYTLFMEDKILIVNFLFSAYNELKKQNLVCNPQEYVDKTLNAYQATFEQGIRIIKGVQLLPTIYILSMYKDSLLKLLLLSSISDEIIEKELKRMDKTNLAKTNAIWKQAHTNIQGCCYHSCNEKSISSHILQKNGTLSLIAEDHHLYTSKTDFLNPQIVPFQKIGINDIFTFKGFCKFHDENIFSPIEKKDNIDFEDYRNQLLFIYRTLMNEKRKKEIMIEFHSIQIQNKPYFKYTELPENIEGNKLGVIDCEFYEKLLLQDIEQKTHNFIFHVAYTSFQDVCISSFFSYETTKEIQDYYLINGKNKERLAEVFISYFPKKDNRNVLIMGYLNEDENLCGSWVKDICNSQDDVLLQRISDIMLRLSEQWVCSESFYKKNIENREQEIFKIFDESANFINERDPVDFNLFVTGE